MRAILSVSIEPSLLYTRGLVLERTGAQVKSATPEIALKMVESCEFGVVVICHSLSDEDGQKICSLARACVPPAKILLIESPRVVKPPMIEPDRRFILEDGPELLVKAVLSLMDSEMETSGTVDHVFNETQSAGAERSARILPFRSSPAQRQRGPSSFSNTRKPTSSPSAGQVKS